MRTLQWLGWPVEIRHAKRLHPVVTVGTVPSTFKDLHDVKYWLGLKVWDAQYWISFLFFNSPCRGKWSRKNRGQQVHHAIHCCHHQPQPAGWGGKVSKELLLNLLHCYTASHSVSRVGLLQCRVISEFNVKTDRPAVSSFNSVCNVSDHAVDCAFTALHLLCSPRTDLDVSPCTQTEPQQFHVDATTVDSVILLSLHFLLLLQLLLMPEVKVHS